MRDTCAYVSSGESCPHLATHYVSCSPYRPSVWNVFAEPIELDADEREHTAEFCLRHAGDVAQARQVHAHRAHA